MEIEYEGITLEIDVTHYCAGTPDKLTGHPDSWCQGDPEELEFEIESATTGFKYSFREWKALSQIEKEEADAYEMKALSLKHHDFESSEEEDITGLILRQLN